jgi:WD40 repeat protein
MRLAPLPRRTPLGASLKSHLLLGCLVLASSAAAASDAPAQTAAEQPRARLDQYGDPLPEGAVARLGSMRLRHCTEPSFISFSPDGRTLATSGWGVRLWDVATGRLLRELQSGEVFEKHHTFSPDGKTLVTAHGTQVHIWDVATGKGRPLWANDKGRDAIETAFSPDGRLLALNGDDSSKIRVYEVKSWRELAVLDPRRVVEIRNLTFSPDGKRLAFGDGRSLRCWDLARKRELFEAQVPQALRRLAFSPSGKVLAVHALARGVSLFDARTGDRLLQTEAAGGGPADLRFTPDGRTLLSAASNGPVLALDPSGRKPARELLPTAGGRRVAAFSPDGKRVALATGAALRIWDLAAGKEVVPFDDHREGREVEAVPSPDGRRVATRGGRELRVWELRTGKLLRLIRGEQDFLPGLSWDASGRSVVAADHEAVRWWNADSGKEIRRLPLVRRPWRSMSLLPDGRLAGFLQGPSGFSSYQFLDARTGKEGRDLRPRGRNEEVVGLAPDGKSFATLATRRAARFLLLRDAATGGLRWLRGVGLARPQVCFSPDGSLFVAATSRGARVWETATGREWGVRWPGRDGQIPRGLCVSPDGRTVAVAIPYATRHGRVPGGEPLERPLCNLVLFGRATGQVRRTLPRIDGFAQPVFTADGRYLVSGGTDGSALVWEVAASLAPKQKAPGGREELA